MSLSFSDFENLFALVIVILVASLVYLFRPGMPESMVQYSSAKKVILPKSGKKEFLKKKKKLKKRVEKTSDELDDSISECSNTSTILNALSAQSDSSLLPQMLEGQKDEAPTNLGSPDLPESEHKKETANVDVSSPTDMCLEIDFPLSESIFPPSTENMEMESEKSSPQSSDNQAGNWFTSDETKLDTFEERKFESAPASSKSKKRTQKKGGNHQLQSRVLSHMNGNRFNLANIDALSRPSVSDKVLTNLSALTDMQTKVKYLEKLVKVCLY